MFKIRRTSSTASYYRKGWVVSNRTLAEISLFSGMFSDSKHIYLRPDGILESYTPKSARLFEYIFPTRQSARDALRTFKESL